MGRWGNSYLFSNPGEAAGSCLECGKLFSGQHDLYSLSVLVPRVVPMEMTVLDAAAWADAGIEHIHDFMTKPETR